MGMHRKMTLSAGEELKLHQRLAWPRTHDEDVAGAESHKMHNLEILWSMKNYFNVTVDIEIDTKFIMELAHDIYIVYIDILHIKSFKNYKFKVIHYNYRDFYNYKYIIANITENCYKLMRYEQFYFKTAKNKVFELLIIEINTFCCMQLVILDQTACMSYHFQGFFTLF